MQCIITGKQSNQLLYCDETKKGKKDEYILTNCNFKLG